MGEIAEDMADGTCCQLCGQYFESGKCNEEGIPICYTHGFPVVCWDCWDELTKEEKEMYHKALKPSL
jgi:hypothetical protein